MVKLYGKIIEFQNMQHGMVQKQVFQQVGLVRTRTDCKPLSGSGL